MRGNYVFLCYIARIYAFGAYMDRFEIPPCALAIVILVIIRS